MLRKIDIIVPTPQGRIVDIRNIDMSDNNNNTKLNCVRVSTTTRRGMS